MFGPEWNPPNGKGQSAGSETLIKLLAWFMVDKPDRAQVVLFVRINSRVKRMVEAGARQGRRTLGQEIEHLVESRHSPKAAVPTSMLRFERTWREFLMSKVQDALDAPSDADPGIVLQKLRSAMRQLRTDEERARQTYQASTAELEIEQAVREGARSMGEGTPVPAEAIYFRRARNLSALLVDRGAKARLASKLHVHPSRVTHLLTEPARPSHRRIEDETARKIERLLGVEQYSLDMSPPELVRLELKGGSSHPEMIEAIAQLARAEEVIELAHGRWQPQPGAPYRKRRR